MNRISQTSKIYADALVKLGQENFDLFAELKSVQEVFDNSIDLKEVLINPTIDNGTKFSIIDEIFSNKINNKTKDFIKILVEKNRFIEFNNIIKAYELELNKINNIQQIEIISAVDINDNLKQQIIEKLQNKLQKNVIPKWNINEEIIGGLVIKIDDDIIDTSLKNKLENLSKNIKGNLWH